MKPEVDKFENIHICAATEFCSAGIFEFGEYRYMQQDQMVQFTMNLLCRLLFGAMVVEYSAVEFRKLCASYHLQYVIRY